MRVREGKGSLVCSVLLAWLTGRDLLKHHDAGVASSRFPLSPFSIPDASCGIDHPSRPRLHGNLIAGGGRGNSSDPEGKIRPLSDPSIRFEEKVCQVYEGFAGIKAGPRKGGRTSARTDRSWAYFCCAGPIEIQL